MPGAVGGVDALDRVDDLEALDDPAEDGVARAVAGLIEEVVIRDIDEELVGGRIGLVAEAMASVPRMLDRPFCHSFLMGPREPRRWSISGVKAPPWIMNPSMTRWKIVPSYSPASA